ncbi:MAG: hypothetical protein QXG65_03205 [Thermoplasmata archaeon]
MTRRPRPPGLGGIGSLPRYRAVRLCASGGGFEAIPEVPTTLPLSQIAERLRDAGIPVIDARVMLIVTLPPELTLSRDGRILVKTRQEDRAQEAIDRLARLLWPGPGAPSG